MDSRSLRYLPQKKLTVSQLGTVGTFVRGELNDRAARMSAIGPISTIILRLLRYVVPWGPVL